MRLIVGSSALQRHGLINRNPADLDIFTDETYYPPDHIKGGHIELHHVPYNILSIIPYNVQDNIHYATPDAIYTLKCSHLGWDIKWEKHARDVIWLKDNGCKLIEPLYWELYKFWQSVHGGKSHLSLDKTKEEFFNDYVNYQYDHDNLHAIVAGNNLPMYTKVLKDNKEVLVSHEKFMQLSTDEKLNLFREEIKVIALERWLIPTNFRTSPYRAYLNSVRKTITNLTKNWATLFVVDNLKKFYIMDSPVWYRNFIKLNGGDMQKAALKQAESLSEEVQAKIADMEVDEYDAINILTGQGAYGDLSKEFLKWLEDTYHFKYVDGDDSGEGQGEYCFAIMEFNNQLYKAEYSYYSYDGHNYENFWDWTPVTAVKKEITDYE